jgi:hypothetical protein
MGTGAGLRMRGISLIFALRESMESARLSGMTLLLWERTILEERNNRRIKETAMPLRHHMGFDPSYKGEDSGLFII